MRSCNLFLTFALIVAGASASAESRRIEAETLAFLPEADVIILGEIHDNPAHHLNQAAAVAAIGAKALVFEMFTEAQALRVTPEARGDADLLAEQLGWQDSGWPDFATYYPIFAEAGDAAIFGGGVDRANARLAVTEGAASVFGGAAGLFGLGDALDDHEQVERENGQLAAHCNALPVSVLPGMVEAQRLRDAALARAVIAAISETGGPVAVITGNGHARSDWGVPRLLRSAAPDLTVLSLAQFEALTTEQVPYDYWLVTEPADREDPCADFPDR